MAGQYAPSNVSRGRFADQITLLHSADPAYFTELHRHFTPRLRRWLHSTLQDRDDTDDVLQETWIRVFERRATLRNPEALDTWIWAICHNVCWDWSRARRRRNAQPLSSEALPDTWSQMQGIERGPEQESEFQMLTDRVDRAICALPDGQFEAVFYRWLLGYSIKTSATLMRVAPGTVKATLHQARARLRAQLAASGATSWYEIEP